MENTDPIFTDGLYLNKVNENAPSFIVANVSVHLEKAIAWMQANKHLADEGGYIRLTGKESRQGKRYFQVDTWKPTKTTETPQNAPQPSTGDGMGKPDYPEEDGQPPF